MGRTLKKDQLIFMRDRRRFYLSLDKILLKSNPLIFGCRLAPNVKNFRTQFLLN